MQDWQRDRTEQAETALLQELKRRYEIIYTKEARTRLGSE